MVHASSHFKGWLLAEPRWCSKLVHLTQIRLTAPRLKSAQVQPGLNDIFSTVKRVTWHACHLFLETIV